jgi:hypothetical protein
LILYGRMRKYRRENNFLFDKRLVGMIYINY